MFLKLRLLFVITVVLVSRFISKLCKTKDYWVFCERGCDARDNAYRLYRYMKENHPEKKVYYIIDSRSADYHKVEPDAIEYGSLKTNYMVICAEKVISTHYASVIKNLTAKYFHLAGLQEKFFFLQHGVTCNYPAGLHADFASMNTFICGAYPEYQYVKEKLGHKDGVVQYTGLARFDNLHKYDLKKQILVMPTWRNWCNYNFKKSLYYESWYNFINDENLIKHLEETGTTLVFYPHYEMQKFIHLFSSKSKNVIVASFNDYDVGSLLKESALLITDYSSVQFDFAYMKKPLLYYQFDTERFFSEHYGVGYFDYKKMGFGKVCETHDILLSETVSFMNNDFAMEDVFENKVDEFFPLRDEKNCERIYNVIISR